MVAKIATETKTVTEMVETLTATIVTEKVAKVDLLEHKLVKVTKIVMAKIVKVDLTKIKTVKVETLDGIEMAKVEMLKVKTAETDKDDQDLEINKVVKVNVHKADLAEIVQALVVAQVLVLLLLQWKKQKKYQLRKLSPRKRLFILAKIEKKS